MRKYQKKKSFWSFLESWPMLFALFALVIVIASGVFGLIGGMRDTIKNKNIARAKVEELALRQDRLSYDIENLDTDAGKEKIFRENYGLARDGEGVIVIVEDKDAAKDRIKEKKGVFGIFQGWFR